MEGYLYTFILLLFLVVCTTSVTSILFLFSLLILFTYIVPYFTLWDTFLLLGLIDENYVQGFFLLIFLCFAGFFLGDKLATFIRIPSKALRTTPIDYRKYETYSIIIGCIGLMGYGYFILASGASYFMGHLSGDFSVGGYIYELRFFIFSAVLLLYNQYLLKKLSRRGTIFLIFICVFLIWDAYIQQQRGSWIRFGVIFIFSYLFHKERNNKLLITTMFSKYKKVIIGGVLLSLILVLTVQIRKFYNADTSLADQLSSTISVINDDPDLLVAGSGVNAGNEFVTAYNGYEARQVSGVLDYGKKWIYPFLNFIPRNLWAGKPEWETYSINIFDYIDQYSRIQHAPGSAETGIIDTFFRFSWFSPLFFLLLGLYTRRLQLKSAYNIHTRLWYICIFIGCFYFFSQNMLPMIIFTLYMYIPVWFVTKTCTIKNRIPMLPQGLTSMGTQTSQIN